MQSTTAIADNSNIPAFLGKLWKMVNDPSTDHLICWSPNANSFIIQNQAQFWYELLPLYYKHNNMSSFVRQLNMYGFHKMSTVENGSMDSEKDEIQFFHPYFQKDQPELLKNIKRKVTGTRTHGDNQNIFRNDELSKVISDIKHLRSRQSTVDVQLSAMKQENAVLWRELAILRQKHVKQQQIVNKLLQFLITLVQPSAPGRMGVGVKRRLPLMITEGPNKKFKLKRSNLNNSNADSGPTIHELDSEIEISPEELFEPEPEEVIEVEREPRVNSPVTPSNANISTTPTYFQKQEPASQSSTTRVSTEEANPDDVNSDWTDKPEYINISNLEDSLSDNEISDEALIGTLQNNTQNAQKVFLNPNNRDALLSNLIGNGSYNIAGLNRKNINNSKKVTKEEAAPKTAPSASNMVVATREQNGKPAPLPEELGFHLEHTQSEIDQLKDLLNGCNSLDANALLGLFNDSPDYGLPNVNTEKNSNNETVDPLVSGNELAPIDNNLIDFTELFDDSLDGQDNSLSAADNTLATGDNINQTLDTPSIVKNEPSFYLSDEDNLPKNACNICIQTFEDFSLFIDNCKQSFETLKTVSTLKCDHTDASEEDETAVDNIYFPDADNDQNQTKSDYFQEGKDPTQKHTRKKNAKAKKRATTKLTCDICLQEFLGKAKLNLHYKESPSCMPKDFKCTSCEKAFNRKHKLEAHMRSHTKEEPFQCSICQKRFRFVQNLRRHKLIHKGIKPFKCEVCGKEFSRQHVKKEHMNIHTGETPYICDYCGKGFKRYANHFIHVHRHKLMNGEVVQKKSQKPYLQLECEICHKIFASRSGLANHSVLHEEEPRRKSFLCTDCGKSFVTNAQLESHARIHSGVKPYECKECGKRFRQRSAFNNHQLVHSGRKPHKCDICEKLFTQSGHLKIHMRTHSGEKPYSCTFCGKPFALKSNLKVHTRIHTGETPYICSVCGQGFYDSSSLKKHRKGHVTQGLLKEENLKSQISDLVA